VWNIHGFLKNARIVKLLATRFTLVRKLRIKFGYQ
jgi:hypothetical protein